MTLACLLLSIASYLRIDAAFTEEFIRNVNLLSGLHSTGDLGADDWTTATVLYGIDRLPTSVPMSWTRFHGVEISTSH